MCGWRSVRQEKRCERQRRLDFEGLLGNGKTHIPNSLKQKRYSKKEQRHMHEVKYGVDTFYRTTYLWEMCKARGGQIAGLHTTCKEVGLYPSKTFFIKNV